MFIPPPLLAPLIPSFLAPSQSRSPASLARPGPPPPIIDPIKASRRFQRLWQTRCLSAHVGRRGSRAGPETEGGGGPLDLPPRSPAFLLESAVDNRRICRPRARRHPHAFRSRTQMRSLIFSCKWETRGDAFCVCVEESGLALFVPARQRFREEICSSGNFSPLCSSVVHFWFSFSCEKQTNVEFTGAD